VGTPGNLVGVRSPARSLPVARGWRQAKSALFLVICARVAVVPRLL